MRAVYGDTCVANDRAAIVVTASAQIARIDDGGSRGINLGYEAIMVRTGATGAAAGSENRVYPRKIGRLGLARQVRVARTVHGDSMRLCSSAPAEPAGIDNTVTVRIDLGYEGRAGILSAGPGILVFAGKSVEEARPAR